MGEHLKQTGRYSLVEIPQFYGKNKTKQDQIAFIYRRKPKVFSAAAETTKHWLLQLKLFLYNLYIMILNLILSLENI